jgi:PUA domain protein
MAPGLTSTGGRLVPHVGGEDGGEHRDLKEGEPVVVVAEGKEEACAVGLLSIGTNEAREAGKGPVVEEGHYLGDGLWRLVTD